MHIHDDERVQPNFQLHHVTDHEASCIRVCTVHPVGLEGL
jgi:hypothetical protein